MRFELTIIRIFDFTHVSYDLWHVRAWLPFIFTILLALLIRRSWKPLQAFVQTLRQDWTQYAFAWYGIIPYLAWASFDEVHNPFPVPYLIISTLALTGGAVMYLRGVTTPRRVQDHFRGGTLSQAMSCWLFDSSLLPASYVPGSRTLFSMKLVLIHGSVCCIINGNVRFLIG